MRCYESNQKKCPQIISDAYKPQWYSGGSWTNAKPNAYCMMWWIVKKRENRIAYWIHIRNSNKCLHNCSLVGLRGRPFRIKANANICLTSTNPSDRTARIRATKCITITRIMSNNFGTELLRIIVAAVEIMNRKWDTQNIQSQPYDSRIWRTA